jgi:hypothetical protein
MCNEKPECQKPEELKGKPQACTPEQIKKCHGDVQGHPCLSGQPVKYGGVLPE